MRGCWEGCQTELVSTFGLDSLRELCHPFRVLLPASEAHHFEHLCIYWCVQIWTKGPRLEGSRVNESSA